jgi:DNA-binding IclR family transcriptional regulator
MTIRFSVDAEAERTIKQLIRRKLECGEPRQVRASEIAKESHLGLLKASAVLNQLCRQGLVDQHRTPEGYVYILRDNSIDKGDEFLQESADRGHDVRRGIA